MDGNSKDNSHRIAREIGLDILNFKTLSRGEAIVKCINDFKKKFDYIIFTSSDGEENYDDIYKFKKYFKSGADLVIASRLMPGGFFKSDTDIRWLHRKIYLKIITFFINFLFDGNIKDCWNGFRGFRLSCFKNNNLIIREKKYLVEAETTIIFLKNKLRIFEFPTKEFPRKYGESSNSIFQSGIGHIILIFKKFFFK